jgi:hypothetical protein
MSLRAEACTPLIDRCFYTDALRIRASTYEALLHREHCYTKKSFTHTEALTCRCCTKIGYYRKIAILYQCLTRGRLFVRKGSSNTSLAQGASFTCCWRSSARRVRLLPKSSLKDLRVFSGPTHLHLYKCLCVCTVVGVLYSCIYTSAHIKL